MMKIQNSKIRTLRKNLPIIAGLSLCLYFSYHTIAGERSYTQLQGLESVYAQKLTALEHLKQKKGAIATKVSMMRPDSLSADLVEEQARNILGYTKSGELIIVSN